jgi:uncharacterized Fe-S radical SAM superfamily protein PflX
MKKRNDTRWKKWSKTIFWVSFNIFCVFGANFSMEQKWEQADSRRASANVIGQKWQGSELS